MLSDEQLARYSRQILVPGVDFEGQERLAQGSILVVGCGGLGALLAAYLAAAGIGHIVLLDDDRVEQSNLPRQVLYREEDVGVPKVQALARHLSANNSDVQVTATPARLTEGNAKALFSDVDLVLDGTDNRAVRCLINREALRQDKPWIMGTAVQMAGAYMPVRGRPEYGCYECLLPHADPGTLGGCERLGILGPVVGSIALAQAMQALHYFLLPERLYWNQLVLEDFALGERQVVHVPKRVDCPACAADSVL